MCSQGWQQGMTWTKACCLVRRTVSTSVSSGIIIYYIIIDGNPAVPHTCGKCGGRNEDQSEHQFSTTALPGVVGVVGGDLLLVDRMGWQDGGDVDVSTSFSGPGGSRQWLEFLLTRLWPREARERWTNRGPSDSNLLVHCNASSGSNWILSDPLVV